MSGDSVERDPILGTGGGDVLMVDTSTSFQWVPDAGNSSTTGQLVFDLDDFRFRMDYTTGQSTASGRVTFDMPSSLGFAGVAPSSLLFQFTRYGGVDSWVLSSGPEAWRYDPQTGTLDPSGTAAYWGDSISVWFDAHSAHFSAYHGVEGYSALDLGHWEMVANPIDTDVFGGAGNDTIYGGQGREVLSGDAGDDVIHVGRGADTVFGGSGNDTIWGGIGTQLLMGDEGDDVIHAGTGAMTVLGGSGNDTLYAGTGNETLAGGGGRDVFAFGDGVWGADVITDFRLGGDLLQVAAGLNGLAVARVGDLAPHVAAGPGGAAVVSLGAASVTLLGLSVKQVETHLQQVFQVA